SYLWDFGDASSYMGASPIKTYTTAGTYTISVTATSSNGCEETTDITITVNPGIPPASITGDLTVCEGATTTLSAPPGYTYLWSDLSNTQTINVGPGTYSVTLTDALGCMLTLEEVTVVEIPSPVVVISGNPIICDNNCTLLSVPFTPGYDYRWLDNTNTVVGTSSSLNVCSGFIAAPYILVVTDDNGCQGMSDPFDVIQATSPSFTISVSPDNCAGTPSTLTVNPVEPDVVYTWSNGMTGPSITVSAAGTYVATGTNTITGCSSSANATINPQPDLCYVPTGCYEVCDPYEVCGPAGLVTYQWNMNGMPLLGETMPCLTVTQSGSYNLTASNDYGCFTTSDSLYLMVINCDPDPCEDLNVDFSYLLNADQETDSCCFSLSYQNDAGIPLQGMTIHTNDADLSVNVPSIDPSLQVQSLLINSLSLISDPAGSPIPTGNLSNFVEICLANVVNDPQQVIIDWYDFDDQTVCSDTLYFSCPVEPDCLYMTNDTIYCEDGLTVYDFTVCNPNDNPFDIGYFTMNPSSPAGVTMSPPFFDLTSDPIEPGTCQSFSVTLSAPSLGGETFCYQLIAHETNPIIDPTSLCCSLDTIYCIDIPFCDPCEFVSVVDVHESDMGCCYDVILDNQFEPDFFDEIAVCVLSPLTTITVNNPFGSGWTTSGFTGTDVSFLPGAVFGNHAPLGVFGIPQICVQTDAAPNQQIEIKWMKDGEVVCRDTIETACEPPCGYLLQESIECDPTGFWNFSALLKNTSDVTMAEAHIHFNDPALSAYNQVVSLGSLAPDAIFSSVNLTIGAPAMPGDEICFTVTLHEIGPDGTFLTCCNFEHCLTLPDCDFVHECLCT
ncbi:MAG: PKD domain-containing protein, partial [Flavobacteriales bacterium]